MRRFCQVIVVHSEIVLRDNFMDSGSKSDKKNIH